MEDKIDLLLKIYRGKLEDLYTFGSLVVVDKDGKIIFSKGNPNEINFPRSSAKLMQAMVPLSLGAVEKFNLSPKEVAQICASHSGEDFHIKTVSGILEKIGLDESYLKCGPHYPFKKDVTENMIKNNEKPRDIHNNCSGKHSGMLMSAIILNESLDDYYKIDHPVQKLITEMISNLCEFNISRDYISVDGCGVPVHALPLYNFAHGMAKLSDYENLPDNLSNYAKEIIEDIGENSIYTSGSDRIDHLLIEKHKGELIVKSGANGFFGGLLPDKKYGFAIKTYDGNSDTRNVILIHLLKILGVIKKDEYDYYDKIADKTIRNHRGEKVGEIIPQF